MFGALLNPGRPGPICHFRKKTQLVLTVEDICSITTVQQHIYYVRVLDPSYASE